MMKDGSPLVLTTTDSNGVGTLDFTQFDDGVTYKLYSSVAKDPNNLSNDYSKDIRITKNKYGCTTEAYLMPEGAVYWYGYKGYIISTIQNSPNYDTNNISNNPPGTYVLFTPSINVSNYTKVTQLFQYGTDSIKLGTANKPEGKNQSKVYFNMYYGEDTNCILGFNEDNIIYGNLYEFIKGHYSFKTYAVWLE